MNDREGLKCLLLAHVNRQSRAGKKLRPARDLQPGVDLRPPAMNQPDRARPARNAKGIFKLSPDRLAGLPAHANCISREISAKTARADSVCHRQITACLR